MDELNEILNFLESPDGRLDTMVSPSLDAREERTAVVECSKRSEERIETTAPKESVETTANNTLKEK